MKVFAGIDVSKAKLDLAVLVQGKKPLFFKVDNVPSGHRYALERVKKAAEGAEVHFCMEATASYHVPFALFLVEAGELVSVENPRQVKHFGLAMGALQKTDRADALTIARYAEKMAPKPWKLADPVYRELVALDRRVTELKAMVTQEQNRLESPCLPKLVVEGVYASVQAFHEQVVKLDARISELVASSAELTEQVRLLETVPGVARRAAIGLLAEAGDLSNYTSAQELAAKFGLNPLQRKSGSSVKGRTKISKAGNAHARARMYMPALVAVKHNPPVRDLFERLVERHLPPKAALVAAERKLVMICFGILKSGREFDPNYRNA